MVMDIFQHFLSFSSPIPHHHPQPHHRRKIGPVNRITDTTETGRQSHKTYNYMPQIKKLEVALISTAQTLMKSAGRHRKNNNNKKSNM